MDNIYSGSSNVRLSNYSLNNLTFIGASIELEPAFFRIAGTYGVFQPAIQELEILGNPLLAQRLERRGFSIKAGVGNDNNFFDVILFKAYDDDTPVQTPSQRRLFPESNSIISAVSRITLSDLLNFQFEAAGSSYSSNSNSPARMDSGNIWEELVLKLQPPTPPQDTDTH